MVRLGVINLYEQNVNATPVDVPILNRIVHSEYSPKNFVNDIAILRLQKPVQFTRK